MQSKEIYGVRNAERWHEVKQRETETETNCRENDARRDDGTVMSPWTSVL